MEGTLDVQLLAKVFVRLGAIIRRLRVPYAVQGKGGLFSIARWGIVDLVTHLSLNLDVGYRSAPVVIVIAVAAVSPAIDRSKVEGGQRMA